MTSKYKNSGKTVTWTDYDYVLEIHFNASTSRDLSGDGSYKGVGMMVHTGESNMTIDSEISEELQDSRIQVLEYWAGAVQLAAEYESAL